VEPAGFLCTLPWHGRQTCLSRGHHQSDGASRTIVTSSTRGKLALKVSAAQSSLDSCCLMLRSKHCREAFNPHARACAWLCNIIIIIMCHNTAHRRPVRIHVPPSAAHACTSTHGDKCSCSAVMALSARPCTFLTVPPPVQSLHAAQAQACCVRHVDLQQGTRPAAPATQSYPSKRGGSSSPWLRAANHQTTPLPLPPPHTRCAPWAPVAGLAERRLQGYAFLFALAHH
jgi:hypothetical protein